MKILFLFVLVTTVLAGEISKKYVHSNNEFAIHLVGALGQGHKGNVVFSAFSPETILGLVSLGAKGNTASEIKKVLQLPSSDDKIKSEFDNVHTVVNKANDVTISSANQVYLAKGFEVENEFSKIAKEIFRAEVKNIDFSDAKNAASEINSWVENKTEHKIKNILKEEQLSSLTKMVLVNALYFKGKWRFPFESERTQKRDFHPSKDQTVQVDTMELTAVLYVHRMNKFNVTWLRMPYGTDGRATMTIVLPDDIEGLDEMHKHLKIAVPEQKYKRENMKIFLPKFRVESSLDLKPILKDMGMSELFSNPDLSGITDKPIKVDAITQKVFIDVDEEGTEAAAATLVLTTESLEPGSEKTPVEYHVNRPFFFCLQYDEVALLTGRIMNPLLG